MRNSYAQILRDLKPGQTWHVNNRYVYISAIGKKLIHFRMLKSPNQKAAASHVSSKEELLAYLERFKAEQIESQDTGSQSSH